VLKSAVSVVAGYLVFAASAALLFGLSGQDPHQWPGARFLIGSLVYVAVSSTMAGFIAVRSVRSNPSPRPAVMLAAVIGAIAVLSLLLEWKAGSVWTELTVIFVSLPSMVMGGVLGARRGTASRPQATA
jgi:hypothetical protein